MFVEIVDGARSRNFGNPYYGEPEISYEKKREMYGCTQSMRSLRMDRNYHFNHIAMYLCVDSYQQRSLDFMNAEIQSGNLIKLSLQMARDNPELLDRPEQTRIPDRSKKPLRRIVGQNTR